MKKEIAIIALVCSCVLMSCASDTGSKEVAEHAESLGQEIVDQVENITQAEDEHVLMVKHVYTLCLTQSVSMGMFLMNFLVLQLGSISKLIQESK